MNCQKQYVAANSYIRGVLWLSKYAKMGFRPRLHPDSSGGAYDAFPDSLVGWKGDAPTHTPPHSALFAPRFSRLWHSALGAFGASMSGGHSPLIFSPRTSSVYILSIFSRHCTCAETYFRAS